MEKTIAILGSTGSIGTQTLEVVRENQDIRVAGLSAGSNITLLEKQIREFHPSLAAVWDEEQAKILAGKVRDLDVKVVSGMAVATGTDGRKSDPGHGDRRNDRDPPDYRGHSGGKRYCTCQ